MLSLHLSNPTFEGAEGIKPIEICRQYYKIKIAQELILQQQLQNVWNMIKLQHIEITLLYSPHLLTNSHTRAHDLSKVAVGFDLGQLIYGNTPKIRIPSLLLCNARKIVLCRSRNACMVAPPPSDQFCPILLNHGEKLFVTQNCLVHFGLSNIVM